MSNYIVRRSLSMVDKRPHTAMPSSPFIYLGAHVSYARQSLTFQCLRL